MSATIEEKPQSLFSRRRLRLLYLAAIALAVLALAYRLREVLNPFLTALLIAYILNPAVQFLEWRARLPRTAAILSIYVVLAGVLAGASTYSIGKTAIGVDKLMTRVAGGWQILPSGIAPVTVTRTPAEIDAGLPDRGPRVPGFPVYADGDILQNPQSPLLGWIDVNGDGIREQDEPEFRRDSGRWRPTPEFLPIVRRVTGYLDEIRERFADRLPAHIERKEVEALADQVQSAASAAATAGRAVWAWITENLFGGIAHLLLFIMLVPVYSFFLLRGFDSIISTTHHYLPGLYRDRIESIVRRIDRACAAFFRGRFLICLGKGLAIWIGLHLAGVEFALTIGLLAGALSLIPAVGPVVGMALAVVCSYGPDGAWASRVIGAAISFGAAEVLEAVANPLLLGREVGLHPVTLLVSLFMFGDLFGFFGVLLAVPLAAIVKILGQEFVLPELRHLAAEKPGAPVSGFWSVPSIGGAPVEVKIEQE